MTSSNNFEKIEELIKRYKVSETGLVRSKLRLQEVDESLKENRKNLEERGVNENLVALNKERTELKKKISAYKREVNITYNECEKLIFKGIEENYTEIYDNFLSRLYGIKTEIIYKRLGDDFDEDTCVADSVIVTKNKSQHGKIIRTLKFGLKNTEQNMVYEKALVEVCAFVRKQKAGTTMVFDTEMFKRR